jgi:hypothetical protein
MMTISLSQEEERRNAIEAPLIPSSFGDVVKRVNDNGGMRGRQRIDGPGDDRRSWRQHHAASQLGTLSVRHILVPTCCGLSAELRPL